MAVHIHGERPVLDKEEIVDVGEIKPRREMGFLTDVPKRRKRNERRREPPFRVDLRSPDPRLQGLSRTKNNN